MKKQNRKSHRKPSTEAVTTMREKRAALSARCAPIIALRKMGVLPYAMLPTVNACLELIYGSETGQSDWGTFWTWKERGFAVKKGEKGFPIWGRPLNAKRRQETAADETSPVATDAEIESSHDYFPLAYIFHAGQVQDGNAASPPFNFITAALARARRQPLALPCPSLITATPTIA